MVTDLEKQLTKAMDNLPKSVSSAMVLTLLRNFDKILESKTSMDKDSWAKASIDFCKHMLIDVLGNK